MDFSLEYKVIDMHTHMGLEYCLYYEDHDVDGIVRYMDEVGVDFIVSSPVEDLMDGSSRREQIRDAMKRYPDKIKGYYCVNPLLGFSAEEVAHEFAQNPGYVGFKFLPDYHRTNLTDDIYQPAFAYADAHNMLVLSHTWGVSMNDESCNSADKIEEILKRYPNLTFLMGHSCQGQVDQAIELARRYPNAYLDLCDTGRLNGVIEKMVRAVGAEKVVFGTDMPMQGFCFQLGCVLAARISSAEKRMILRDNAIRILGRTEQAG